MTREPAEKIACPHCGYRYSRVLETRSTRRRRQCEDCGETFPTLEVHARTGKKPRHRTPVLCYSLPF